MSSPITEAHSTLKRFYSHVDLFDNKMQHSLLSNIFSIPLFSRATNAHSVLKSLNSYEGLFEHEMLPWPHCRLNFSFLNVPSTTKAHSAFKKKIFSMNSSGQGTTLRRPNITLFPFYLSYTDDPSRSTSQNCVSIYIISV